MIKIGFAALMLVSSAAAADSPLDAIRIKHGLPALSRALVFDGHVEVESSGVRKAGDAAPVERGDRFHLGSCTKAMTATVAAIFVERKALRWDEPLTELLPGVKLDPAFQKTTLEMLLAHRSGLAGDVGAFDDGKLWAKLWEPGLDPSEGRRMLAKEMLAAAPASAPGSRFEYSNANYMIVGAVLERVSGLSWETVIQKELFRPLKMRCGFGPAADPRARVPDQPWGHVRKDDVWSPVHGDNPPALGPAGTVSCSLADWAKFARLHLDGGAGRATPLLSPKSFAKLHAAYPGQDYTYGGWIRVVRPWAGKSGTALTHQGSNTMNTAVIWLAPERGLAALAAANAAGESASRAVDEGVGTLIQGAAR